MGISIKSKSNTGFVVGVDSVPNETKQYGLKVTATLSDGTVVGPVTKSVNLVYNPVNAISITGDATISDQENHVYTLAYGPENANVGVASVQVTTNKASEVLAVTSQSTTGFTLKAGVAQTISANIATVTVTATLTNGAVVTHTKDVALPRATASISGPAAITAINGTGSENYTFTYSPSSFSPQATLKATPTCSNSAFSVSNATGNGFTLNVDMGETQGTISTKVTAVLVIDGDEITVTRNVTAAYVEKVIPFVLRNIGESADISMQRGSATSAFRKLYYAVVSNYDYETNDDTGVEYQEYENDGTTPVKIATLQQNQCLLLKCYSKQRIAASSNEYASFVFTQGNIEAYGPLSALDGYGSSMESFRYYRLFFECTSLTKAPELPATTLANDCYRNMFRGCTGLTQAPALPATTLKDSCYENMFSGCTGLTQAPALPATSIPFGSYSNMFAGCTGLTSAPVLPATSVGNKGYEYMFSGCTGLTQAPALPATTLSVSCYCFMFQNCTKLTFAPALPATTMKMSCYNGMFMGCTSLLRAPALPATALDEYCYDSMFRGCTSLIQAPELPATIVIRYAYANMFYGCTSLTQAPELPATRIYNYCYGYMFCGCSKLVSCPDFPSSYEYIGAEIFMGMFKGCTALVVAPELNLPESISGTVRLCDSMFHGCTSLTTAPKLLSTRAGHSCYEYMFYGCTSLTVAPALPATTLDSYCYRAMFCNCRSLVTAPALPATTLASDCYNAMFGGCTSLTVAPALPATTLASDCYWYMFQECTSLTTAPELPAESLVNGCYTGMFSGCSSLNAIKAMFTTTPGTYTTYFWLEKVAANGVFVKNAAATWNVTGISGVPSRWTIVNTNGLFRYEGELKAYNGNGAFECTWESEVAEHNPQASCSTSGVTVTNAEGGFTITASGLTQNTSADIIVTYGSVSVTKSVVIKYEIIHVPLIFTNTGTSNAIVTVNRNGVGEDSYAIVSDYTVGDDDYDFMSVTYTEERFASVDSSSSKSLGPGKSLFIKHDYSPSSSSYFNFQFTDNNIKVSGDVLALTNNEMRDYSCFKMFNDCLGLSQAPALPATSLAKLCYGAMFSGCTSLATTPELPAMVLATSCYDGMFYGCIGLREVHALPATTLAQGCYAAMFYNCTSLTTAPELPATTLASSCYAAMFYNCTSLTTAPELPATTLASSCYQGMFRNCTSLTTAPELPAITLDGAYCYNYMFFGCTSLNYVKALFTTAPGDALTSNWLANVSATGTFVKNAGATWDVEGNSGVPSGWTIEKYVDPILKEKVGNILCSDGTIVEPTIAEDGYTVTATNLGDKTPIGVLVIPASFIGEEKARFMSVKNMSCGTPESGTDDAEIMYFGGYNADIADIIITTISTDSGDVKEPKVGVKYPYYSVNTLREDGLYYNDNTSAAMTPINADGSVSQSYLSALSGRGMDGEGNTNKMMLRVSVSWDGDTIANSKSTGNYPSACCCRRFNPDGKSAGQWYLPAIGELGFVLHNLLMINNILNAIGAPILIDQQNITASNQYDATHNYYIYPVLSVLYQGWSSSGRIVRAFYKY